MTNPPTPAPIPGYDYSRGYAVCLTCRRTDYLHSADCPITASRDRVCVWCGEGENEEQGPITLFQEVPKIARFYHRDCAVSATSGALARALDGTIVVPLATLEDKEDK